MLACVLAGMALALSRPGVISAGMSILQATENPAAGQPSAPAATVAAAMRQDLPSRPSQQPTSAPEASGAPGDLYFSEVEAAYFSPEKDHWTYTSPSLFVEITMFQSAVPDPLIYYVAEVRTMDPALLKACYAGDDSSGKKTLAPEEIATQNGAVIAVTSDGFTSQKSRKGIVIRCGELKYDNAKADTLAILPDGVLRIYKPQQIAPTDLIAMGVRNAFSYGPVLVKNGKEANVKSHRLYARSARTGVGMVEPGHYVFIVVDGVDRKLSVGVTLAEFSALFIKYGCVQAYNLEGGRAAALCFMGEQINGLPSQRNRTKVTDLLTVGESDLVLAE